jgi:hypothetical protein
MTVGKVSSLLQSLRDFLAKKPPKDHFCQEKVNRQGPEGLAALNTRIQQEILFDVMIVYYKAAGIIPG